MTALRSANQATRRGIPFAWLVFTLSLIFTGGYIFFSLRNGAGHFDWTSLAFAGFPLTGALIIYRQPHNRVGWMLAIFGFCNILSNVLTFVFSKQLNDTAYRLEISLFPLIIAFMAMILSGFFKATKELNEDNEMII
jgi:hypothetical protein